MPDDSPNELDQGTEAPAKLDKENAFLLYAVFCGDAERTAHALDVDPDLIRNIALDSNWDKKLKPIIDLKQSARAGDVERAINRALNFTQTHRYRLFLQRVLKNLTGMSVSDMKAFLFPHEVMKGKDGNERVIQKFSTRALADFASALEKCHTMSYLALNDTATERKERKESGDEDASASEMHIRLAEAMAKAGGASKSIRGLVLDAQLEMAQEHAKVDLSVPFAPPTPNDHLREEAERYNVNVKAVK